ncbi:MAG: gliding motility-associated ABC transporter substrate-binding protein GldG [Paludibacteraceae bacterium]|nr:gliding motility-associated ABC transporter substrate-binding protein GldG [Paludibacteraceae bacterium]
MTNCVSTILVLLWLQWGRFDLTADQRYSISSQTRDVVEQIDAPLHIQILLDEGKMNPGFQRLKQATYDLTEELETLSPYLQVVHGSVPQNLNLQPIVVHERSNNGQMVQTQLYPYALVRYKERLRIVSLLQNNPGRSGEENLNSSIESLEYRFAEAFNGLIRPRTDKVAFIEGHGELTEQETYDWCRELSRYYQIDRGVLDTDAGVLDGYRAVVVASPSAALSENDKFILDQYIMKGGRVMWLLDGVRFSDDMLQSDGLTPVIAEDWGLRDLLFRYGVRINPVLVQDLQCRMMPVEVSGDKDNSQFQPMPWTFAPLLLTDNNSPITKNIAQVMCMMASEVERVGGEDSIDKHILLATSTASRKIGVPAEVDLTDMTIAPDLFQMAFIPVAMSLEGEFTSLYAHRMSPKDIQVPSIKKKSERTRQVVVACGRVAINEWQQGEPLPLGYDRYMQTQFGNRDFLTNCILWLTDENNLMALRGKHVQLRLLNDHRSYQLKSKIQTVSLSVPIAILALVGASVYLIRRKKYVV